MKQYLIFALLSIFISTLTSSCKKSPTTAPPVAYNTEFPNNIGTFWQYKLYDSFYNRIDTVTIKVVRQTTLDNGEPASEWQVTSLYDPTATHYVTNKSDGIRIYNSTISSTGALKKYLFPLSIGSTWTTRYNIDTNRVTQAGSISVIAGNFSNAYRINRDVVLLPGYNPIKEDEWFVPNVGMVSRYYFEIGPGYIIKNKWELLNYSIK